MIIDHPALPGPGPRAAEADAFPSMAPLNPDFVLDDSPCSHRVLINGAISDRCFEALKAVKSMKASAGLGMGGIMQLGRLGVLGVVC